MGFAAAGCLPVQGALLQEAIDVGVIVNAPPRSKTERRRIEQLLSNGGATSAQGWGECARQPPPLGGEAASVALRPRISASLSALLRPAFE